MFFLQMAGFPGSGKSTLALEIANRKDYIIIDHDVTKTALLNSSNEAVDRQEAGKIAYNIDFALVDFYLAQGRNVILDSPCLYEEIIERGTTISHKYGANYKYIECYLDDFDEINKRLKNRSNLISQISEVKSKEIFYTAIKSNKKPLNYNSITINTSKSIDTYIDKVIDYLSR